MMPIPKEKPLNSSCMPLLVTEQIAVNSQSCLWAALQLYWDKPKQKIRSTKPKWSMCTGENVNSSGVGKVVGWMEMSQKRWDCSIFLKDEWDVIRQTRPFLAKVAAVKPWRFEEHSLTRKQYGSEDFWMFEREQLGKAGWGHKVIYGTQYRRWEIFKTLNSLLNYVPSQLPCHGATCR